MQAVLAALPEAKWVSWEPDTRDNARAGAVLAFGEPVEAQYRLDQADVDPEPGVGLPVSHPASLRLLREFGARRKVSPEKPEMNRLYVVEGSPTPTGAIADHRLSLRSSQIEGFARAVAAAVGVAVEGGVGHAWVAPIASDLRRAGAQRARDRRRVAAAGRARDRARDQRGARRRRHDGRLHAAGRGLAARRDRRARGARRRDAGRHGRGAGDPGRQPGLRRRRPTSTSPRRSTRCRCASTTASTSTRRPSAATGTCRPRTRSRAGATCARSTARSRSCSR